MVNYCLVIHLMWYSYVDQFGHNAKALQRQSIKVLYKKYPSHITYTIIFFPKQQTVTHAVCPRCRGTTAGWWSTPAPCPRPRGTASPRAWPRWCWGGPGRGPAARRGHWSLAGAASRHMSPHYTLSYKHWHRDKRWAGVSTLIIKGDTTPLIKQYCDSKLIYVMCGFKNILYLTFIPITKKCVLFWYTRYI